MKKCNYKLMIIMCLFIHNLKAQYPFDPTDTQHKIAGTVGEERGGRNRYHYGLDFSGFPVGTNVYAIESGPLRKNTTNTFAVGRIGYIHVIPTKEISMLENGAPITAGELIGTLQNLNGAEHVHLQEATTDIYKSGLVNYPSFAWEDQSYQWINPILSRHPADTESPVIDRITLYRQGDKNNTDLKDILKIYGAYDLMVETKDARILPDGTGQWGGVAPLKIQYKIKDNAHKTLLDWTGIDFSVVPPNRSASTIFGKKSNFNTPKFEYIITNDPFHEPFDKALNFRRHLITDITTDIPTMVKYRDGTKFTLETRSCDESSNCATQTLPTSGTYELDNFLPYLTEVNIKYNGDPLHQTSRVEDEGSAKADDGYIMNQIHEYPLSSGLSLPNTLTLEVLTSEPMQNVRYALKKAGPTTFPNPVPMTQHLANKLLWTATITSSNIERTCYNLEIKGQDLSENELMDVY